MIKLFSKGFFFVLLVVSSQITIAQNNYEPLHGVTGYDYTIKGEMDLTFTNSIDFKNGDKQEGTYHIKSPVLLAFNLNDLMFFKADPKEFTGYVENPFIASCGKPCGGGLLDIPQGGYQEEENWMWVDEHLKWWDGGELTEVKAHGEIYPVLEGFFSIPDYADKYKAGIDQLQFRIAITGISDPKYHPTRNVAVEYFDNKIKRTGTETDPIDAETMKNLELADPELAAEMKKLVGLQQGSSPDLSVSVSCGSFYGQDLTNALMANSLLEADKTKKEAFERPFEQAYFKDLPRINALKLINFLITPAGNYETPITGSFSSDSETGSERATYQGTLRFWGGEVRKEE